MSNAVKLFSVLILVGIGEIIVVCDYWKKEKLIYLELF